MRCPKERIALFEGADRLQCAFIARLSAKKRARVLALKASLWEADPVLAVTDGGGEADRP